MRRFLAACLTAASLLALPSARASFHTFVVDQLYSNADGSVQYVVMHESAGFAGEYFLAGHTFQSNGPGGPKSFTFPNNLPSSPSTAGRRFLIASTGFAALGILTPDYVIPNGFLPLTGGMLNYAGFDMFTYAALPTDGVNALYRSTGVSPNFATNFAGQGASVQAPPPVLSFQGIWWAAPAGSQSGWGLNVAHQGDTIFASWFTYDPQGKGWWLVMTAQKIGANIYQGQLFETTGPSFDSVPFNPLLVVAAPVGTGTLTFTDANTGNFSYTVDKGGTVTQSKAITREVFGPLPTCVFGAQPNLALATNYQDIWWKFPATSESGWGINLNHQGDTIFATWFTYDRDGTPVWLVVTAPKTGANVYSGDLYRTSGARFDAFDPANVVSVKVGSATFTFTDGNDATFMYTVQLASMMSPVTQSKAITREIFTAPGTVCQ